MPLDIELYSRRLEAYNIAGKEGQIDSIKGQIINDFQRNPSYFDVLINGIEKGVHIISGSNKQYKLLCKPDENIKTGDYITWNDKMFLCTSIDEDNSVQSKGVIQKANFSLKWISSSDNLITKPAITSAQTLYTTGVKDEKVIQIPDGMQGIQLSYDEDTKNLKRKDSFVFNGAKYQITFLDKTTYPGLLVLICQEYALSHLDDTVNEIADRWIEVNGEKVDRLPWLDEQEPPEEPIEPEEPISGTSYSLTIETPYESDDPDVLYYEETYNYIVTKLVDGVEVEGSFTFELSSEEHATITGTTSNSCEVTAKMFFMTQSVTLTITDIETDEVAIEKEIILQGM